MGSRRGSRQRAEQPAGVDGPRKVTVIVGKRSFYFSRFSLFAARCPMSSHFSAMSIISALATRSRIWLAIARASSALSCQYRAGFKPLSSLLPDRRFRLQRLDTGKRLGPFYLNSHLGKQLV